MKRKIIVKIIKILLWINFIFCWMFALVGLPILTGEVGQKYLTIYEISNIEFFAPFYIFISIVLTALICMRPFIVDTSKDWMENLRRKKHKTLGNEDKIYGEQPFEEKNYDMK